MRVSVVSGLYPCRPGGHSPSECEVGVTDFPWDMSANDRHTSTPALTQVRSQCFHPSMGGVSLSRSRLDQPLRGAAAGELGIGRIASSLGPPSPLYSERGYTA